MSRSGRGRTRCPQRPWSKYVDCPVSIVQATASCHLEPTPPIHTTASQAGSSSRMRSSDRLSAAPTSSSATPSPRAAFHPLAPLSSRHVVLHNPPTEPIILCQRRNSRSCCGAAKTSALLTSSQKLCLVVFARGDHRTQSDTGFHSIHNPLPTQLRITKAAIRPNRCPMDRTPLGSQRHRDASNTLPTAFTRHPLPFPSAHTKYTSLCTPAPKSRRRKDPQCHGMRRPAVDSCRSCTAAAAEMTATPRPRWIVAPDTITLRCTCRPLQRWQWHSIQPTGYFNTVNHWIAASCRRGTGG